MERLNKIFAEWAKEDKKTELASEKVELGLVDDLDKNATQANDILKQLDPLVKEITNTKKLISKTDKEYSQKIKVREKAKSAYEKAQTQATKLESDYNMAKTQTDRSLEDLYDYQDGLNKEEKQFKKLKAQADKTINTLNKNIGKAKKAEKDLGIKIPALAKYQKSADLLDKLIRNA